MQQQQSISNDIHCKVQYGNEFRRFLYDNSEFAAFLQQIKGLFGFSQNDNVVLKYKDEEGDMVTISSDEELEFAIDVFAGGILRFTVYNREVAPETCQMPKFMTHPEHGHCHKKFMGHHEPGHFGGRWGPNHGQFGGRMGHCGKEGRGAYWRERWINKMQANPELLSQKIEMLTKKRDLLKSRLDWIQDKDSTCPRKEQRKNHLSWKLQKVESRLAHLQAIVSGTPTSAPAEPIVNQNQVPNEFGPNETTQTSTKAALQESLRLAREKRETMSKAIADEHKEMQSLKSEIQAIRAQGRTPEGMERISSLKETLGNYRAKHQQKKTELQAQDATIRNIRAQIQSMKKEKAQ